MPATTPTAAPRMTRKSHQGTPRIGTGLLRNGRVFFTVIDWVCGPMMPDDGVTTTSYGPSASPDGRLTVPRKNPSPWVAPKNAATETFNAAVWPALYTRT